jgi:hypothetical protein
MKRKLLTLNHYRRITLEELSKSAKNHRQESQCFYRDSKRALHKGKANDTLLSHPDLCSLYFCSRLVGASELPLVGTKSRSGSTHRVKFSIGRTEPEVAAANLKATQAKLACLYQRLQPVSTMSLSALMYVLC